MTDYNKDGILILRNAIVEQVAKDYIKEKTYIIKNPDKPCKANKAELDNLTDWFLSNNFEDMDLKISGEYIIKLLDEIVESDVKPTRRRVGKTYYGKKKS